MLRHAPGLYERIYRRFGDAAPALHTVLSTIGLAEPAVRRLVATLRPPAVLDTFHLSAPVTGRLRRTGGRSTVGRWW